MVFECSAMISTMGTRTADETSTSEDGLVAASRNGDEAAFGALVRRHQQRVFRLAGRFFRRHQEVEDVAQETFLRAWEKLASYRGDAPFESWLTRICLNCCYQRLRRAKPEDPMPEEGAMAPDSPHGSPVDERLDARRQVQRLLARLPATDRFILQLLHGEEWSVAEIAQSLGWTRVNVKVRAHRARVKLRKLVEEEPR